MYINSLLIQGNLCGIYLQMDNCSMSDPDNLEWKVDTSSVQKPPISPHSPPPVSLFLKHVILNNLNLLMSLSYQLPNSKPGSPTIKVLHIADVHWYCY